ncbi:MAG TPA: tetratricopeptide repeat protein [Longimicrobiales bacterium]
MRSLFGALKQRAEPPASLATELEELEKQAQHASPGYDAQLYNRAADLCLAAGDRAGALKYLGRAIDVYLDTGRFNAAAVLCQKVLRISPDAVRARSTLTWLALGQGDEEGAKQALASYVLAAQRAGQEVLALKQLHMMAEATPSASLREAIAYWLIELGDQEGGDLIFGELFAERNGLRPPRSADQAERWLTVLRATTMGPKELRRLASERDGARGEPARAIA